MATRTIAGSRSMWTSGRWRRAISRGRERFEVFLEKMCDDSEWLARLEGNSKLVERVADIFEHSQYFGDQLLRHPEMLAGLDSAPLPPEEAPQEAIADSAGLRSYFRRHMFCIQSDSMLGPAPIFETLERTSDLADDAIAAAYRIALEEAPPPANAQYVPARQMMVVSLGRLGMREFDLASDADLVFVIPDEDAAELGRRATQFRGVHVVDNSGHSVQSDQPRVLVDLLRGVLDGG